MNKSLFLHLKPPLLKKRKHSSVDHPSTDISKQTKSSASRPQPQPYDPVLTALSSVQNALSNMDERIQALENQRTTSPSPIPSASGVHSQVTLASTSQTTKHHKEPSNIAPG
ncbi:hypothetical protein ABG768_025745 [Culter alburnus]|uniref:Uncharacterized protein n=1 Tax=Culter alburnus TaxID=194366 RepID=A0AAW2AHB1_CULAL